MLNGEATNTNFIVFGFTLPGLEPTIYRTRGEHANHYASDAVYSLLNILGTLVIFLLINCVVILSIALGF